MPEVYFRVRWPDASAMRCYSPSSTIRDYFQVGESIPVPEFVSRSRNALEFASQRVREKFGYGCGHADVQIDAIERMATRFAANADARVTLEAFED